jgi:hypothetical protein
MAITVNINKNSLNRVNAEIQAAFGQAFKNAAGGQALNITLTNHAQFAVSLPEAKLFLRGSVFEGGENRREFEVMTLDELQRIASSIAQIAHLRNADEFVTLEFEAPQEEEKPKAKKAKPEHTEPPGGQSAQAPGEPQ